MEIITTAELFLDNCQLSKLDKADYIQVNKVNACN